jgi:hypothetical protein
MDTIPEKKHPAWLVLLIFSALQALRLILRLVSGPSELGQGPGTERLSLWVDIVMIAALAYSLFNLDALVKGREDTRTMTLIVLFIGLACLIIVLLLGD